MYVQRSFDALEHQSNDVNVNAMLQISRCVTVSVRTQFMILRSSGRVCRSISLLGRIVYLCIVQYCTVNDWDPSIAENVVDPGPALVAVWSTRCLKLESMKR